MRRICYLTLFLVIATAMPPAKSHAGPEPGKEWFEDARLSALNGEWDQAISALNDLLARYPSGRFADDAYFWLGYSYNESGRYREAARSYRELSDRYPDSPFADEASLRLARILELYLNDSGGAQKIYRSLARDKKAHSNIRLKAKTSLASNYERQKDYSAAVQVYEETERELSMSRVPTPAETAAGKKMEQKKSFIKQGLEESPEALSTYTDALNLFEEGRYSRSGSALRDLLSRFPDAPVAERAMVLLARSLDAQGRGGEAMEVIQSAREKYPRSEAIDDYNKDRRNRKVLQKLQVR